MKIKINCELLNKQIQMLDVYASLIVDERKRNMVDGVVNLLDHICWALEEGEDICFERTIEE